MGYLERKIAGVLVMFAGIAVVLSFVAVGPWMLGKSMGGPVLGAVFEALYIIGAVVLLVWAKSNAKARARALAEYRQALIKYRVEMSYTNTPWLDEAAGHFRHSTCTIRHRSYGAAARCGSRI